MDTLIFGGLLAVLVILCGQRSRRMVLGAWWVLLIASLLLMAHHITGGLGLGLNY
ncbi:DUF5993 family protein [Nocardia sp. XZ_19_369]|uniref:DUF5993 family protein n=1 Tax=Nocardia sp. XZ_19_369 TaxID=2769487 RepID=UPI00188E3686|nr:DUF5993 family protein [Nocardia sp. XZ_19_369]